MTGTRAFDGPVLGARYALGPLLGRGGVGEVRQAWDGVLHRRVAVKLLPGDVQTALGSAQRLHGEALAAARLNCPQVVALYDYAEQDGKPYLVMECLPGSTWADELQAGPPTRQRVVDVAGDVLAGLAAAHSAGIVHRDVKPTNILLTERGTAKLGDFGLAQSGDAATLTLPGSVVGTFAYMAPERFAGAAATHASDIWSVGVMLYESLTGRRPFFGDSPFAVAVAVQRGTHVPLAALRADLPRAISSAVEQALSTDPLARPGAADLRAALHRDQVPREVPVPLVPAPTGTVQLVTMLADGGQSAASRPRPGRRLVVPAVVLAAVAAIVVSGSLLTGKPAPASTPAASGYSGQSATSARPSGPATTPSRAPARKAVTDASAASPTPSRRTVRADAVVGTAESPDNSGKGQGKSKSKGKSGKVSKGSSDADEDDDGEESDD